MQRVRGEFPRTATEAPLSETVTALGREVRDLRASARLRAVIEQAKGILVERHQISLDEAFAMLRSMSQEHNVRLVEVAATLVGIAVPDGADGLTIKNRDDLLDQQLPTSTAMSGAWRALREQPDVKAGVASALVDSLASSADQGDQAARLMFDLLLPHGIRALAMYRAGVDGALRLVGTVGVPGDLVSSWRSIPPSKSIPYVRALMEDRSFFWPSRKTRLDEFPESLPVEMADVSARAVIPVRDSTGPIGSIGLMWGTDEVFDEIRQTAIISTVERVAPILIRNVAAADPELEWLESVMGLQMDPWLLLDAEIGLNGIASDFTVQDASVAQDFSGWIGRRVLELWPQMASDPVLAAMTALMRTGGLWSSEVATPSDLPWGVPGTQLRAVRLGNRLAITWRPPAS